MDEGYEHKSLWSQYLDSSSEVDMSSTNDALNNRLELWKAINSEVEKNVKFLTDEEVLQSLLNDQTSKAKAAHDRELKWRKDILKIQKEIDEAADKGLDKELQKLEKRRKLIQQTHDIEQKTADLADKWSDELEALDANKEAKEAAKKLNKKLMSEGLKSGNFEMFKDGLTGGMSGGAGALKALDTMTSTLANLVQKLDKTIEEIASYKSDWDTRLFGSSKSHSSLVSSIQHALGASPYAKQSEILKSIDKAVELGISYNIEQRAFLQGVKDDIAGTFDAFDSTLLQIIRVQQSDSTAARMGMEAALNEFLNKTFETTEYLSNVSDNVTGALYQATSLLSSSDSVGFEYQVQKWLGSLYSVGMSQGGVQAIANALGQLASGDISGTSSGAGKLLVMSASRAGLSYSDLLTQGINNSEINSLLESMVGYLQTIADSNKVVQTQLAGVYGLTTSDIQAARNLNVKDIKGINNANLNYSGAVSNLLRMGSTIGSRMSMGEMLGNITDNLKFTLSAGIAENPALYAIWSIANMLDQLVGGIPIPSIGAFAVGSGIDIDLETTVADIMRVGALSGGLLSGIGSIISGLANNVSGISGVMQALGVSTQGKNITRGGGLNAPVKRTTSSSNFIGNSSGNDVYDSSMAGADDQKNELAVEAKDDQQVEEDIKLADVNATAVKIYELLETVISGGRLTVAYDTSVNGFPNIGGF